MFSRGGTQGGEGVTGGEGSEGPYGSPAWYIENVLEELDMVGYFRLCSAFARVICVCHRGWHPLFCAHFAREPDTPLVFRVESGSMMTVTRR